MPDSHHTLESKIPDEWIEELQLRLGFRACKLLKQGEYEELESLVLERLKKRVRLSVFSALFCIAAFLVGALLAVFVEGVGSSFLMFSFAGIGLVSWLRDAFDVKGRLETHAMLQAVRGRAVAPVSAPISA